jgi:sugar/nucleoside kinase (ribokinase family)
LQIVGARTQEGFVGASTGRRIAVLGTINRDTIRTPDGIETESFGGILYSLLPLSAIVKDSAAIFPLVNVGEDMREVVTDFLEPCNNVHFDGVSFVPDKNTHCFMVYDEAGHKQESLLGGVPKLTFDQIKPYFTCDALVVNFITGTELELGTLQDVRKASSASVFMDIHSLTLGMDDQNRRFWRVPDQWEEWIACTDVIQMNEQEAALLAGHDLDTDEKTTAFGERLLSNGSSVAIITRNENGSDAIYQTENKTILHHSPPQPAGEPHDETGCGDVFLMGFMTSYLDSQDPVEASRFANTLAGINVTLRGIEGVQRFGEELDLRSAS